MRQILQLKKAIVFNIFSRHTWNSNDEAVFSTDNSNWYIYVVANRLVFQKNGLTVGEYKCTPAIKKVFIFWKETVPDDDDVVYQKYNELANDPTEHNYDVARTKAEKIISGYNTNQ